MADFGIRLDPAARDTVARDLQASLVDLVALALQGKQGHWHVTGRHFTPVHEQLDLIVEDARAWSDLVAERAVTLGVPVDGRPATVARDAGTRDLPEGFLDDDKVVELVAEVLGEVAAAVRERAERVGEHDLVTQDLLLEVQRGLEKHLWMLQAQIV
jgi:starvation-inducible DNA-binding protein